MTVSNSLPEINRRILALASGTPFTSKGLLIDLWEQIPKNMRTTFGLDFRKAVISGEIKNTLLMDVQTSGRKREYKRK